jgi:four helix bundle protein
LAYAPWCATSDNFRQLVCWQLAHALKCEVLEITAKDSAASDFKYCDQIRSSSASAPANIAEAFGHFASRDSVRLCGYAVASLHETLCSRLLNLARAALKATKNWLLYLKREADRRRRSR